MRLFHQTCNHLRHFFLISILHDVHFFLARVLFPIVIFVVAVYRNTTAQLPPPGGGQVGTQDVKHGNDKAGACVGNLLFAS